MKFKDIIANAYNRVKEVLQPEEQELLSPIPVQAQQQYHNQFWDNADLKEAEAAMAQYGGKPEGKVLGATTGGRNPKWEQWKQLAPKSFEQLLSGAQIASEKHGVPADLLMDIAGAETSGGQFLTQMGADGNPVPNGGRGFYMFEQPTLNSLGADIDPYSATASADLAAQRIKAGELSRWGTSKEAAMKNQGKYWGTLDNPNNQNGSLIDFYSPEELNQFLAKEYQVK